MFLNITLNIWKTDRYIRIFRHLYVNFITRFTNNYQRKTQPLERFLTRCACEDTISAGLNNRSMSLSLAPKSCWSFLEPPPEALTVRVGVPGELSGLFVILTLLHDRLLLKTTENKKRLRNGFGFALLAPWLPKKSRAFFSNSQRKAETYQDLFARVTIITETEGSKQ